MITRPWLPDNKCQDTGRQNLAQLGGAWRSLAQMCFPSFGKLVPKHFDLLSPKMMARSAPEASNIFKFENNSVMKPVVIQNPSILP